MTVDAVVFDIGNVLLEWEPTRFYDDVIGKARSKTLFEEVDLHAMNIRVDLGEPLDKLVQQTAAEHPKWEREILMWDERWIDILGQPIDASVAALRQLRQNGVRVLALSNFGVETFERACARYEFLGEFDERYISGHLKLAKPDPAIYEVLEKQSGIAPSRLLFADDRPENIDAAQARGWQTHLFTDAEGWVSRLGAAGLISKADIS